MNTPKLTRKDFQTDQGVRWCPGCGDYAILAALQKVLPEIGVAKENIALVSGIGCSSRLPYYVNTYGFHTLHGRAFAVATGLRAANPDVSVWIATGDGDSLSIGGNHLIHILRRNVDVNILLFNNEIYGLTKGQYSPTSSEGTRTKSSPFGSIDRPFDPAQLALGARATFFARTIDKDPAHMAEMMLRAQQHRGTSLIEIYQNCNIFNDGAHDVLTDKETKHGARIEITHGEPLLFGADNEHCVVQDGFGLSVRASADVDAADIVKHDEQGSDGYHRALAELRSHGPTPIGVLRSVSSPTYDERFRSQIAAAESAAHPSLQEELIGRHSWHVPTRTS
jgi:2-oxoglutarate ferredoxin oxidoreductase subunit beta